MILAMWEKRKGHAMTPFQRRWLYPMAWRRLNKYLPGYLLCFSAYCSMLEFLFKPHKCTIHIISFSIAVVVPRKALMLRRPLTPRQWRGNVRWASGPSQKSSLQGVMFTSSGLWALRGSQLGWLSANFGRSNNLAS